MDLLMIKGYDAIVITDVRFPNEVQFIKNIKDTNFIIKVNSEEFT